jgi:acylphosphatase
MKTIAITVKGKVQGVNYRYFIKTKAQLLGLTGTVKNLSNGDVLIKATGEDYQLKDLLTYCEEGPSGAVVSSLTKEDLPLQLFTGFEIIR